MGSTKVIFHNSRRDTKHNTPLDDRPAGPAVSQIVRPEIVGALSAYPVKMGIFGADCGYDSGPLMIALDGRGVMAHVAMRSGRGGGVSGTGRRPKRTGR